MKRIDGYVDTIDFREMQSCVSYPNCFIQAMNIDQIREFKHLIDWDTVIVEFWTKRKDFRKICKEFKKDIRKVYDKWGYEELDELTEEEWKECLG